MADNSYQLTVRDYMNDGIGEFASKSLAEDSDQIAQNAIDIDTNEQAIAVNATNIATNATNIATNTANITTNTANIATNATNIATNTTNIATNATNIATNATNITTNTTNLTNHEADNSAHGVSGDNVGTLDYCSLSVGGVALLCESRGNSSSTAEQVTQANATVAPAAYNQAQIQTIVSLANDTKEKYNQLETDFQALLTAHNDLLAKLRTAKQLNT